MLTLPEQFVLFDTEYTAWEGSKARGWSGDNEQREIVQIGALQVGPGLIPMQTFNRFVRPKRNPTLSAYFIDLTGISQDVIDEQGTDFQSAICDFAKWCNGLPTYSFGCDGDVVFENCVLTGFESPMPPNQFHNIRSVFRAHGIDETRFNSCNIVEAFDIKPSRRSHNALDDVLTVHEALICLNKRLRADKK